MDNFVIENKKKLILLGILVICVIVFSIINGILKKGNTSKEEAIKGLAKMYYEDILYPNIKKEVADPGYYFTRASEDGIKVTLQDMVRAINDYDSTPFYHKGNYCDFAASYIIFYPKGNYNKEDYRYTTSFSCIKNFEN